jgi:tetratricopeptide (TPR) repeat protein
MRLSLCLIARNEEQMLPGCLSSVEGTVDEIVLVDTGSSDATPEIARRAGAIVLQAPWQDDFSAPRNLAARRSTGDFILQLDADERLAPGAGAALRRALERAEFDLGFVRLHNASRLEADAAEVVSGRERLGPPGILPRVLRRTADLEWRGVVHESVVEWWLRRGKKGALLDVDLVHLGAIPSLRSERGKRERNVRLLFRRCELEPEDGTAFGYLAMELRALGRADEAAEAAERGWAMIDRQPRYRTIGQLAVARALCALRVGDVARARDSLARAAAQDGPHPDFAFLGACGDELLSVDALAGSAERRARLEAAVAGHLSALELLGGRDLERVLVAEAPIVLCHLGSALVALGRAREARVSFEAARGAGGGHAATWGEAEALLGQGDAAAALRQLEPALDDRPDGWAVAAFCSRELGSRPDARLFAAQARGRAARGFASPLRAARLAALEAALGGV